MKLKTPTLPRKGHHQDPAMQPSAPAQALSGAAPAYPGPAPTYPTPAPAAPAPVATAIPIAPVKKTAGGLATQTRKRNVGAMVAGLAFIVVAAVLAASVAASFDDSIDVLVAANEIAEGQPITEDDFRVVQIAAADGDIQAVSPESLENLVGRIAAGPIGAGSMIHPDQFSIAEQEEMILIGAELGPNQFPAAGLKPGDKVRLIAVSGSSFGFSSDDEDTFVSGQEIALGTVHFVNPLGQDQLHFSLQIAESSANVVAQLVSQNRITLGLIDESIAIDQVTPLTPASPVTPLELDVEAGE